MHVCTSVNRNNRGVDSHHLNEDSVYGIAEICGGTVKISLFVLAVQIHVEVHACCAH